MNRRKLILLGLLATLLLLRIISNPMGQDPVWLNPHVEPVGNHTLAAGEGWLEGFRYREKFAFSEATGAGTDYQIRMIVYHDTDDGSDGSGNICTEGNAQADFDDIRFTDDDGSTELDYWLEEYTASTSATFWFEVRDSLESGQNAFAYIYYGNAGVSTTSNGTNTFIWFDDFSSDTGWSRTGTTMTVSGGYLHWDATASYGDQEKSIPALGSDWAMGGHANQDTNPNIGAIFLGVRDDFGSVYGDTNEGGSFRIYDDVMSEGAQVWDSGGTPCATFDENMNTDTDYWWNIRFDGSSLTLKMWTDHYVTSWGTGGTPTVDFNPVNDLDVVSFCTRNINGWDGESDYMYIRKWVSSEPYVVLIYSEEQATPTFEPNACTNPDDTNHLYAQMREYLFTVNVTQPSGYADIDYIGLSLYTASPEWNLKYIEDTNVFSENPATDDIELVTGNCEYSKSGTTIDLTFAVKIEWAHPDSSYTSLASVAYTEWATYNTEETTLALNVETRLDFSSFSLDDNSGTADRGNYDTQNSIDADGTIEYFESASDLYPPDDVMDIWVTCPDTPDKGVSTTTAGAFHITVDSDDVIGLDTYTFKIVQDGAGAGGADECHETHTDTYIADRVQVQSYSSDDARINIGTASACHVTLYYDYLNQDVEDGTVTINGVAASYSGADGIWDFSETEEIVMANGYNDVNYTGGTHGITKEDQNGKALQVIWDRVQISTTTVADNRVNINDNVNIDFTLIYDFDDTLVMDGTVTIEGLAASYQGSGVWRITRTSASVISVTYDEVTSTGNEHGITVVDMNGKSETVIWDSLTITVIGPSDQRISTGSNASGMVFSAVYDYDSTTFDGSFTLNDTTFDHGTVGKYGYTVSSVSGGSHGITVISTNDETYCIFDAIKIDYLIANKEYASLDTYVQITARLRYEYDSVNILAGSFSLQYGSTYLTLTHSTSGIWFVNDISSTPTTRTYDSINGTSSLHGISSINMNGKSDTVHWDVIVLTVSINLTWTIVDYNISILVSGVYQGLGFVWNGTATLNSAWTIPYYPSRSTAGNYSFVVTSITNDDNSLVGFTANEIYCVWDDIAFSSPVYYWVQYTVDQVWLIWYAGATTYWEINGTCDGVKIQSHMNGTDDDWTYVLNNATGEMSVGPFNTAWYFVNITINAEVAGYDWIVWTRILTVDILHSINIEDSGMDVQDDWITFWIHSSWGNSTFTIADNMTGSFVEVGYSDSEGWYQIAKTSVIGTHWYWILVNGSHSGSTSSGQTLDPSLTSDSWVWLDFKFTVNPVTFSITSLIMLQNNESVIVQGFWHTPNITLTWIAYEGNVEIDSGVLTLTASGEYNAIYWLKNEPTQFRNLTLSITADGSTINLHSYSLVLDSATYLTSIHAPSIVYEGDTFLDEITTYENPPGFYITAETAAVVAISGVFIAFLAYLVVRNLLQKKRIDVESEGS